jgi:hypothetical protein
MSMTKEETDYCHRCHELHYVSQICHTWEFGTICFGCYDDLDEEGRIKTFTGNYEE